MNEPTAIVQLDINKKSEKENNATDVVQFEMDKNDIEKVLQSLEQLDQSITSFT